MKIGNYYIDSQGLLYNTLLEDFTREQVEELFEKQKKWEWVGYLFVPIYFLLKTSIISSVLYIGAFFYAKSDFTFKRVWDCVLKAEFVFLLIPIFKIIWFNFFQTNYSLEDIQYFFPLSALNITGYKGIDPWLIYPLQTLNLFEITYWLILAYYIGKIVKPLKSLNNNNHSMDFGLKIVTISYGSALLLWVCVVMFFTLNYS